MNIFVKNISFKAKANDLKVLFEEFGNVKSCKIIKDKETGKSRGFGFVEMPSETDGRAAINALHEFEFMKRKLHVVESDR